MLLSKVCLSLAVSSYLKCSAVQSFYWQTLLTDGSNREKCGWVFSLLRVVIGREILNPPQYDCVGGRVRIAAHVLPVEEGEGPRAFSTECVNLFLMFLSIP